MKRLVLAAALFSTVLYAALTSLWWYPAGLPGEERRAVPVSVVAEHAELRLELDGSPVPLERAASPERRLGEGRRMLLEAYGRPGTQWALKASPAVYFALDPVIPSVGAGRDRRGPYYVVDGRRAGRRPVALRGRMSRDLAVLRAGDGPRPGLWTREDHWVKASWSPREALPDEPPAGWYGELRRLYGAARRAAGAPVPARERQESVLNVSEMMRGLEANLEDKRGGSDSVQFVILDMWSPLPPRLDRELQRTLFAAAALCILCAAANLACGMCRGEAPRSLLLGSLGALALGPLWFPAARAAGAAAGWAAGIRHARRAGREQA